MHYFTFQLTRIISMMKKKLGVKYIKTFIASSGNRTRAARVAGEHSTTEPTMLHAGLRN